MRVCWISAGVSSFMSGVLARGGGVDKWIYIDVTDQHPDSLRFIKDCEKAMGIEIEIIKNQTYKDVNDCCLKTGMVASAYGTACTRLLKKQVRKDWERSQYDKGISCFTYIWGYDINEKRRATNIQKNFPEFNHEFPLIERGLSKEMVHGLFGKMFDFNRPIMYDLGYQNNNCIGCLKGGMGYWNKIRKDFPEVFEKRAVMERQVGHSCIKGVFLDELEPDKGYAVHEIMEDCDLMCHVTYEEIAEQINK